MSELPSNERVVVRVPFSGVKRASPISVDSKCLQVLLAFGREEVEPVVWILESRDLVVWDHQLLQDLILGQSRLNNLGVFLDFLCSWLIGTCFSRTNFSLQSICRGLDWHSRAVESKGEQNVFAELSLEPCLKLGFG